MLCAGRRILLFFGFFLRFAPAPVVVILFNGIEQLFEDADGTVQLGAGGFAHQDLFPSGQCTVGFFRRIDGVALLFCDGIGQRFDGFADRFGIFDGGQRLVDLIDLRLQRVFLLIGQVAAMVGKGSFQIGFCLLQIAFVLVFHVVFGDVFHLLGLFGGNSIRDSIQFLQQGIAGSEDVPQLRGLGCGVVAAVSRKGLGQGFDLPDGSAVVACHIVGSQMGDAVIHRIDGQ